MCHLDAMLKGTFSFVSAIITLVLVCLSCDSKNESTRISLFSSDSTVSCYRIPALTVAPNGDIIAAIDQRVPGCADLRANPDINIVIRRSMDNGRTWRDIESIIDYAEGESASDPSFITDLESGEIFLFYNYMNLNTEPDIYYFHMISSTDNGQSWSEPVDITDQLSSPGMKSDFKFITSGHGIQASDGTLYHTIVNLERGVFVFGSRDHGKSWFYLNTALSPGDESKIVELGDGTLMVNSRINGGGQRYVHTSNDGGRSWQSRPDSTLIDPACNASLLYDSEQDVLYFTNPASTSSRSDLVLRTSYDQGNSWPDSVLLHQGSAAYSSMVLMKDGNLGVLFETDDYMDNVFLKVLVK